MKWEIDNELMKERMGWAVEVDFERIGVDLIALLRDLEEGQRIADKYGSIVGIMSNSTYESHLWLGWCGIAGLRSKNHDRDDVW